MLWPPRCVCWAESNAIAARVQPCWCGSKAAFLGDAQNNCHTLAAIQHTLPGGLREQGSQVRNAGGPNQKTHSWARSLCSLVSIKCVVCRPPAPAGTEDGQSSRASRPLLTTRTSIRHPTLRPPEGSRQNILYISSKTEQKEEDL